MKLFKYLPLLFISLFFSCSSDDDATPVDEVDGLYLMKQMENDTHAIELYNNRSVLNDGYNKLSIRIKDKATNAYRTDAIVTWMPVMHMTMMTHSGPNQAPIRKTGTALYEGFVVFQMPGNATEYWELTLNYTIDGTSYTAVTTLDVLPAAKRRVTTFLGSDNVKYIVALMEPESPAVGLNTMTAGVFKMASMMSFPAVDGYTVAIDPRMPGMGNHGSPNNVNLTQTDGVYSGSLSLTMTGYWKINLRLLNADNVVLKGEEVTEANPSSSIFFEVEF